MIAQKYWQKTFVMLAFGVFSLPYQFPQATLHQVTSSGGAAVTLGVSVAADTLTPLKLQVEVRPLAVQFTGVPTGTSGVMLFTDVGTITVPGLANGSYHWRGRLIDTLTGATSLWQNFGGGEVSDFTVIAREPVVIVPGIAGTVLQTADGAEAWPNIDQMFTSPSDRYLDALALGVTGGAQGSTIRTANIIKTAVLTLGAATLFSKDFYGNLMKAFVNEGYVEGVDLFTMPYDWRLDITSSVSALTTVLTRARAASPTGKVDIVAHSMGGLLVKKYLAGISNPSFIDKVVLAGVPELGAPYALKLLNYGDDLGIPIANQGEMKKIAQNMPAAYELLPGEQYVNVVGDYVHDLRNGGNVALDLAATARLMENGIGNPGDRRNAALVALGEAFHRVVDAVPVAAPNVYTIIGCGKPTITGYDLYDNGVVDLERGSGDGTVPEASAMGAAGGSHEYFVMSGATGIDHTGLVSDARSVALITDILNSTADAPGSGVAPLPQGISASHADCATQGAASALASETTIEFSAHGAATGTLALGVYDVEGNYTGVTASGTVVTGIPGSEYEKLGDNVFVLVPAGENYRAIDRATTPETFTMKVKGYRAGAADREANYLSVPLAGSSSVAELDFGGFDGNMDLRLGRRNGEDNDSWNATTFEGFLHPAF